jgi:hypothetical protein
MARNATPFFAPGVKREGGEKMWRIQGIAGALCQRTDCAGAGAQGGLTPGDRTRSAALERRAALV